MVTVWSDIVPRRAWRDVRSVERVNKARIKVNRALGCFFRRNGAVVVRHRELGINEFWRDNGVHLNVDGNDKTVVRVWWDAWS